jgi:molybdopterin adenylyltransferase
METLQDVTAAQYRPRAAPNPVPGRRGGVPILPPAAMPIDESRRFVAVNIAVLTVSDTRSLAEDTSGQILVERLNAAGHRLVDRQLLEDDADRIEALLRQWIANPEVDVVISTGGTGLTGRDVTPEAYGRVLEKTIDGFGELFRMLSYQKIGTSTIQSRALGGVAGGTYLFALPGSNGAVKDGWDEILKFQLDARHRPCNLVELMPRLREHRAPAHED